MKNPATAQNEVPEPSLKKPIIKVIVLSCVVLAAFLGLFDYLSTQYVKEIETQRLNQMKQLVEIARNTIEPIVARFRAGDISRDTAISEVRNLVRRMTFKESSGSNYIFMSAYDGTMLVQPFQPTMEMSNQWDLKDTNGVFIIRELVEMARQNPNGGFVQYYYTPPGSSTFEEKISFVRGINELECYIGTGRYMGDLRRKQSIFRWKVIGLEIVLVILLSALCLMAVYEILARNRILEQEVGTRKNSEKALRELKNYLGSIIDSMPSVIIGMDPDGMVTQWNLQAEKATGLKANQAVGKDLTTVFPDITLLMDKIKESIRTRRPVQHRQHKSRESSVLEYEDVTIFPLLLEEMKGAVIRIDDVTEKVRMEELVVQSEKMMSVGGLAAGMAHEINNPLAGMMQMANLMSIRLTETSIPANQKAAEKAGTTVETIRDYMEDRGIPKMIEAIRSSGDRAAAIVENMLNFARKGGAQTQSEDVANLMDATLNLATTDYDLKRSFDFKTIQIQKEYQPGVDPVPCDRPKIQQVLLNILQNGAYAMQTSGTQSPTFTLRAWKENNMACMEIEDNGPGMDEDVRKRIFEPFFTTKPTGIGTGLGLSVSYFIITQTHKGQMEVHSQPGQGTKFTIRLPY